MKTVIVVTAILAVLIAIVCCSVSGDNKDK